ncbi:Phage terminase, small subunit [Alloalcanivorax xenomutans]|uniref:DUF3486 family protein n=1 Tax=Alloalcanivorax xenomutans TaxID=1094342 RepID=UPI0006D5C11F|nr:DUF3486 family protein [Alloalcanivorax xenomutans]CUR45535.1 Phage terminase, small subunit [Alloalcanivorax xenomutans]
MGRKSSITELDPEIRAAVDAAIREGRASIDDIVELINEMGGDASRSAVGRYRKNAVDQMRRWQEAREISKVWVGKLEEDPSSDVGRLISEMLKTVAFQTVGNMVDGDNVEADQVMLLARALKDIAGADKLSADRELKIRKEERDKAAKVVEEVTQAAGMDTEQVDFWRKKVLGMTA